MKVSLYSVDFQSEHWDLPPWVSFHEGSFLDKSQAIAYIKNEWEKLDRINAIDCYTISKQVETPNGITMRPMYKFDGTLHKIRRDE